MLRRRFFLDIFRWGLPGSYLEPQVFLEPQETTDVENVLRDYTTACYTLVCPSIDRCAPTLIQDRVPSTRELEVVEPYSLPLLAPNFPKVLTSLMILHVL